MLYAKICKLLSISCLCNQTSEFASTKRIRLMCGGCTLIASGIGSTTVSDEIASKFCRCGIQVVAAVLQFRSMTPNHALHRTLNQRRFACWFRAGEGKR